MNERLVVVVGAGAAIGGILFGMAGCTALTSPLDRDYQLGDNVAHYCESADESVRAAGRLLAKRVGLTLPDLCAAHALVEGEASEYEADI